MLCEWIDMLWFLITWASPTIVSMLIAMSRIDIYFILIQHILIEFLLVVNASLPAGLHTLYIDLAGRLGILWFCILNSLILLICRSQVIFALVSILCIFEYKFPDFSFEVTLLTRQLSIQGLEAWIFESDRLSCKHTISAPLIRLILIAHPQVSHLFSGDNHTCLI